MFTINSLVADFKGAFESKAASWSWNEGKVKKYIQIIITFVKYHILSMSDVSLTSRESLLETDVLYLYVNERGNVEEHDDWED